MSNYKIEAFELKSINQKKKKKFVHKFYKSVLPSKLKLLYLRIKNSERLITNPNTKIVGVRVDCQIMYDPPPKKDKKRDYYFTTS